MRQFELSVVTGLVLCTFAVGVRADVSIVIEHRYTIGNDRLSCFAYNSLLDPHEFLTTGYGAGKDLRWSRVLDDSVEPWEMEGEVLMQSGQMEFFARDGYASYSLSFNTWGMAFNPLDEKYFLGCISILRDPFAGGVRVESERDLIQLDPNLPNGIPTYPSGVTVSRDGGYLLIDDTLGSSNGFIASGVEVGDQLTLYPVHWSAEIFSETYTIIDVVSDDTLRLDKNPLWPGSGTQVDNATYILMMQPWLTLKDFRDTIPYFADHPNDGPKAHFKGGLSPDHLTYYVAEIITDNVLAVDTQQRGTFSAFVAKETLQDYVQAEIDSGRNFTIYPFTDVIYDDDLRSGWSDESVGVTVDLSTTDPVWGDEGESIAATFEEADAVLWFHYDLDEDEVPRDPSHYTNLEFQIHGGTTGGQEMTVQLNDATGTPGTPIAVPAPSAGTWTHIRIPVSDFGVGTIGDIVWTNTAGAAQPQFFLDQVELVWVDPLPDGVYEYDVDEAGPGPAQVDCDADGRVWFPESQSDDILWTTDGVTLNTFLYSYEMLDAYVAAEALDPADYSVSNGVQVMGLIVDPMGTVYWSDNQTDSIWKAPADNPADHIVQLATKAEIQEALGLTRSPRGMNNFTLRGMELLTFNYVDSNTVYKVDLNTQDYGDLDADFDADLADYGRFQQCLGFDLVSDPEHGCRRCDLDHDEDVDLDDYTIFEPFVVGPTR